MRLPPINPKRILVVKLGHIGDVLVTTPVVSALRQAFGEAAITMLVNEGTEPMVAHNPDLAEVIALRRSHQGKAAAATYQMGLLKRLRRARYDLCLELSGGDRGAWLSRLSGARFRVGFQPKRANPRARAFHLMVDQTGTDNHVVETFLRQPAALGIEPADRRLRLEPGAEAEARAREIMVDTGLAPGGFAVVHPTSRWMFKSWTAAGNARLIEHLSAQGLTVALTCGPEDKEKELARAVRQELASGVKMVDLAGALDLYLLGALIAQARLFCGVDSAPMHMAAALGTPVLALFGPSGERMWGPWQVPHRVVALPMECRPCGRDGCEGGKVSRCLTELDPALACRAVDELLGGEA